MYVFKVPAHETKFLVFLISHASHGHLCHLKTIWVKSRVVGHYWKPQKREVLPSQTPEDRRAQGTWRWLYARPLLLKVWSLDKQHPPHPGTNWKCRISSPTWTWSFRICMLSDFPGDSLACWSMRPPALGQRCHPQLHAVITRSVL